MELAFAGTASPANRRSFLHASERCHYLGRNAELATLKFALLGSTAAAKTPRPATPRSRSAAVLALLVVHW